MPRKSKSRETRNEWICQLMIFSCRSINMIKNNKEILFEASKEISLEQVFLQGMQVWSAEKKSRL
jgi:hypothetical protein